MAVFISAAFNLLIAWLFPLLLPDAYAERLLRTFAAAFPQASSQAAANVLVLLPYVLVAVVLYFRPLHRGVLLSNGIGRAAEPPAASGMFKTIWPLAASLIAILAALAYHQRFLADDAFISFRYARNLARGFGLVFNPGEHVEGYTNFLWVLLMAGGIRLGWQPEVFSAVLGVVCFAGTLAFWYKTARMVLPGARWALAAAFLIGTQYTVLSFATSGLETSLQTCLLAAAFWVLVRADLRRSWRRRDSLLLSSIVAVGVLTRMDFAVFGAVLLPAAVLSARRAGATGPGRGERGIRAGVRQAAVLLAVPAMVVACWWTWKLRYYGSVLPNTYYERTPGLEAMRLGAAYLWTFCASYRYLLPGAAVLLGLIWQARQRHILIAGPIAAVVWMSYVAGMGGDFMEFRLLAPIIPILLLTLVWAVVQLPGLGRAPLAQGFLLLWTAYGSLSHCTGFISVLDAKQQEYRPEPVYCMRGHLQDEWWIAAGQALGDYFGSQGVRLATTAAGALPYYADLPTLDLHGLCDETVVRKGMTFSRRPGHQRWATFEYMKQRGVNLVIGHPWTVGKDELAREAAPDALARFARPRPDYVPAVVVAVPIAPKRMLMCWYLTPHPAVDQAIAANHWQVFAVPPDARSTADAAATGPAS